MSKVAFVEIQAIGLPVTYILEVEPTLTLNALQVIDDWVAGQRPLMGKQADPAMSSTLGKRYLFGANIGLNSITSIISDKEMAAMVLKHGF